MTVILSELSSANDMDNTITTNRQTQNWYLKLVMLKHVTVNLVVLVILTVFLSTVLSANCRILYM